MTSELPNLLRTERFGRQLRWSRSTASTNTEAAAWALDGATEGATVGTDHQTSGRGRYGNAWSDSPGHNLLFSVVLRPTLSFDRLGLVPLAAGLAVADLIEQEAAVPAHLKWPNDVMINDKKVCGILLEGQIATQADARSSVVLGIGLNVNQTDFPAGISTTATSIALETGQIQPRPQLLAALLLRLESHYESLATDGGMAVRAAFAERMVGINEAASVRFPLSDVTTHGTVRGICDDGALRLLTDTGERCLHAGEISFRGTTPPT